LCTHLYTFIEAEDWLPDRYSSEKHHVFGSSNKKDILYTDLMNVAFLTKKTNQFYKKCTLGQQYVSITPEAMGWQCLPVDKNLWKRENQQKWQQERRYLITDRANLFIKNIMAKKYYIPDLFPEEFQDKTYSNLNLPVKCTSQIIKLKSKNKK
jgi:hypothetical protein